MFIMDILFADGLCIRPFRFGDADAFACAVRESAASIGRWLPWCRPDYSRKDARAWIAHCAVRLQMRMSYDVGIFSEDGKTLYGGIAVNQVDTMHNMANIGYWVRTSMQRRGIATCSVRAIAAAAFSSLNLTRLEIIAAEDNLASRGVAEKAGAVFECIARNRLVIRGTPVAAAVYSLVPGDI